MKLKAILEKIRKNIKLFFGNHCVCKLCGEESFDCLGKMCKECWVWQFDYDDGSTTSVTSLRIQQYLTAEEFKEIRDKIKAKTDYKIMNQKLKEAEKIKKKYLK